MHRAPGSDLGSHMAQPGGQQTDNHQQCERPEAEHRQPIFLQSVKRVLGKRSATIQLGFFQSVARRVVHGLLPLC